MLSASCTVTVMEPTYTVTLNPNEGTIADGKNVTGYVRGTVSALPTAADITREGYLFKGWYEAADFSGSPVTAITATDTGDKTFTPNGQKHIPSPPMAFTA
ncbi:MAG: InlB B-repeat-containing protein [Oscillospiraceae bacterium]